MRSMPASTVSRCRLGSSHAPSMTIRGRCMAIASALPISARQRCSIIAHSHGVQAANTLVFLAGKGVSRFRDLSFTADEPEPGKWRMRWLLRAEDNESLG